MQYVVEARRTVAGGEGCIEEEAGTHQGQPRCYILCWSLCRQKSDQKSGDP